MKLIVSVIIGFYFGFILGVVGFSFLTWQFWAIYAPVTIGYWVLIFMYASEPDEE